MTRAFFEPTSDPDRFVATANCHGSWSTTLQHGGPPSALLARTVERLGSSIVGPTQVTRITTEILGPVPLGELTVGARVVRPGRSVELVEAHLDAGGRTAMTARAWRMRLSEVDLPVPAGVAPLDVDLPGFPPGKVDLPPIPAESMCGRYANPIWNVGYADAVDWRFVVGGPDGGSPAAVWARPRIDLVAGEETTPLARLMILADTGNGLSRVLDIDTWWFINTELTVHLHRQPAGEWFLLAARSTVESTGAGMTETELYDTTGRVGRAAQSLMVGPR